ncbi:MAG: hypothetical protein GY706_01960, partial [Bacteroides sp.]|nr:hypothetical protein [Bacteroides sp.]
MKANCEEYLSPNPTWIEKDNFSLHSFAQQTATTIPRIVLYHSEAKAFGAWLCSLSSAFDIHFAQDFEAVENILTDHPIDIIISEWHENRFDKLLRCRRGVRFVHLGSELTDAVIDASAQGYDVISLNPDESLDSHLRSIVRAERSKAARHRISGATVHFKQKTEKYKVIDISNEGIGFCVEGNDTP